MRARSKTLRKKMFEFMAANYRPWGKVTEDAHDSPYTDESEGVTDDLSWDDSGLSLGFHYGAGLIGWERPYIYAITRWMAIQVGKRMTRFSTDVVALNVFKEPVPYILYDGYEPWPVLVVATDAEAEALPKDHRWLAVDKYCIKMGRERKLGYTRDALGPFFDKDLSKKWRAAIDAYGKKQGECPEDGPAREEWLLGYENTQAHVLRHEIARELKRMRTEMKRLDDMWQQLNP